MTDLFIYFLQDCEDFDMSIEEQTMYEFLKMASPVKKSEATVTVTGVRLNSMNIFFWCNKQKNMWKYLH